MDGGGVLEWCNATRFSMANDPGRQLFHDQVQNHGLLFLDDYLDNILAGPRRDPLIELVKTPGRNKASAKKLVSSSALKTTVTYSLEDDSPSKENVTPVNAFHQKLIQAQNETIPTSLADTEPVPVTEPPPPVQSELFVITEDDENERSRVSLGVQQDTIMTVVAETHQPIPAEPECTPTIDPTPLPPTDSSIRPATPITSQDVVDTEMRPVSPEPEPVHSTQASTDSTSSITSVHKPSLPALPAPMPFRKSFKAPVAESSNAQTTAVTPGAGLKRTSWLMKAREVKMSIKRPTLPPPAIIPPAQKRKSGDMLGLAPAADTQEGEEEEAERPIKAAKVSQDDVAATQPKASDDLRAEPDADDDGLLTQLKKTVDGLGARLGKSMGKSLGGTAANALAEARAAAEARIAERNNREEEELTVAMGEPVVDPIPEAEPTLDVSSQEEVTNVASHSRLSVSDLVTSSENTSRTQNKPLPSVPSPPLFHRIPAGPVFNKPVFTPPKPSTTSAFKLPATNPFSRPAPVSVGLGTRLPSPHALTTAPLSAQSTLESIKSETIFDSQETPAWMPSTQETEYTSGFGSQSQCSPPRGQTNNLDDDDSWPLQERLAATSSWLANTGNAKDDSLTWSTLPTSSVRRDTGTIAQPLSEPVPEPLGASVVQPLGESIADDVDIGFLNDQDADRHEEQPIPGSFHMDIDVSDDDEDANALDLELQENETRSQSQMSLDSTTSSQSHNQGGFFGHATKLVSSMLGSSKKGKPEVKSLQLAAAAAKKQQEEKEKKANRLKEMENRRQAALQRKADEEKAKALEEERKLREDNERRKKERDELTDKRPLVKSVVVKKIPVESEKKPELKKVASKPNLNASTSTKVPVKSNVSKLPAAAPVASTSKPLEMPKTQTKGKMPVKATAMDDDIAQPSQILQTQMAARAKAQLQAANPTTPVVASENIELPDINSEYSDSDDEDRPRSFNPPSWAQSPDLRQALEMQSTINPDDIFGAIRPLKMDELFRNRTGRFRARTSSANWTGTDGLTIEEQREYVRRMGYKP